MVGVTYILSLVLICRQRTWDIADSTAWDNCDICEHLLLAHKLTVPGIDHRLACEVELIMSSTSQASRRSMPGTDYVLAINVRLCRSVVPGHAGGHVPSRLAAYENQALHISETLSVIFIQYFLKLKLLIPLHPLSVLRV